MKTHTHTKQYKRTKSKHCIYALYIVCSSSTQWMGLAAVYVLGSPSSAAHNFRSMLTHSECSLVWVEASLIVVVSNCCLACVRRARQQLFILFCLYNKGYVFKCIQNLLTTQLTINSSIHTYIIIYNILIKWTPHVL